MSPGEFCAVLARLDLTVEEADLFLMFDPGTSVRYADPASDGPPEDIARFLRRLELIGADDHQTPRVEALAAS